MRSKPVEVATAPARTPHTRNSKRGTPAALRSSPKTPQGIDNIEKTLPSALAGTDLAAWLARHGIDTLAVAGYMTHNCNDSTVRQALHAGFAVEFLADAAGSLSYENRAGRASAEEIHRVFIVVMQSRFAAVASTDEWIAALQTGTSLPRDSIHASNRRARGLANGTEA